jgi:predicted DNA binding CopG/RHH family protein
MKKKSNQNKSYKAGRPKKTSTLKDKQKTYNANITDYDFNDTTAYIDKTKSLTLTDLGFTLPETAPTQVVSIRLPTTLLNQLRALGSEKDIPYQALIKLFLDEAIRREKKKSA